MKVTWWTVEDEIKMTQYLVKLVKKLGLPLQITVQEAGFLSLQAQVKKLTKERDHLQNELKQFKGEC